MGLNIIIVLALNFIIALIGTLAYSVRIVGVRTGKIAISFALFNALTLISSTANVFQLPILTKFVNTPQNSENLIFMFNLLMLVVLLATVIGALLIPTFQRIFSKAVESFSIEKSFYKLMIHSFSKSGVKHLKKCATIPIKSNFTDMSFKKLPVKIFIYNVITVALLTVGVFAPIYAGSLEPDLSATCITLSGIINGIATVLLALFVNPYLSVLTDEVIEGKYSEADFRGCVIGMVGSKILGTVLSFLIFIPAAYAIVFVARIL
jgi:hypothetical protein